MTRTDRRFASAALLSGIVAAAAPPASAQGRYSVYNDTTRTDFLELYLAPAGSAAWGPNQALNDKDKSLEHSERLRLVGVEPGRYDVRLVDSKGRTCMIRNVDLTQKRSFDIRDADLKDCR